jgi:hypothetical protein
MAWISFAIVVLFLYTPVFGLGRIIQEQTFPPGVILPAPIAFLIERPYGGYVLLFLSSLALWGFIWLILRMLEAADIFNLQGPRLRNGMLYALLPPLSNHIAVILATLVLAKPVLNLVLSIIAPNLLNLFPFNFELGTIVLALFTLIVAYFFGREQRSRYEAEIRRNQERKYRQDEIIVPGAEK